MPKADCCGATHLCIYLRKKLLAEPGAPMGHETVTAGGLQRHQAHFHRIATPEMTRGDHASAALGRGNNLSPCVGGGWVGQAPSAMSGRSGSRRAERPAASMWQETQPPPGEGHCQLLRLATLFRLSFKLEHGDGCCNGGRGAVTVEG